jgi:hypothetical protein
MMTSLSVRIRKRTRTGPLAGDRKNAVLIELVRGREGCSGRPQNNWMTLHEWRQEQKRSFSENSFAAN